MKTRWRLLLIVLGLALLLAMPLWLGPRPEPVYQGKSLSYWVTRLGSDDLHGAPKDAVAAVQAIGPQAVPFLLDWMPHRQRHGTGWLARYSQWCSELLHRSSRREEKETPNSECVEFAWWALGTQGKSAIPALARVIQQPPARMDDYDAWTRSAKAISYLGPEALDPMLRAATNMVRQHELWELLHNFENLGTNGAPAVPALLHWVRNPDYFVRAGIYNALGGIGKRPDLAVPVLLAGLQDPNSMARRDAATALGSFADDSPAVLPALVQTLQGNDWEARGGALSGLGRIQSRPEIVVPLIAPYLSDSNSVVARSAAYALRDLGSRAALLTLLRTTNQDAGLGGIRDIVFEAIERLGGEEEEARSHQVVAKLAGLYAQSEATPQLPELNFQGKPLSQLLHNPALAGPPLRLDQMLTLRRVPTAGEEDEVSFELPLNYDALTNLGALRLLCDADPNEKPGNEAMVQECQRATNGNCRLVWNTCYDPPGQHFLQAELLFSPAGGRSQSTHLLEPGISLKGPLFSFLSTNSIQFFPHADIYTEHGAYFRGKLARPVGSYSLELTTPAGQHLHTLTGSTTNGLVEVQWNLLDDQGQRYTQDSFNSSWTVTFPDAPRPGNSNATPPALDGDKR